MPNCLKYGESSPILPKRMVLLDMPLQLEIGNLLVILFVLFCSIEWSSWQIFYNFFLSYWFFFLFLFLWHFHFNLIVRLWLITFAYFIIFEWNLFNWFFTTKQWSRILKQWLFNCFLFDYFILIFLWRFADFLFILMFFFYFLFILFFLLFLFFLNFLFILVNFLLLFFFVLFDSNQIFVFVKPFFWLKFLDPSLQR